MSRIAKIDLEIIEGATFEQSFIWKNHLKQEIDLSDVTAIMQVRESLKADNVLYELTTSNNKIIIENQTTYKGKYTLKLSAIETKQYSKKSDWEAFYDLQVTFPNGDVQFIQNGIIRFKTTVTR